MLLGGGVVVGGFVCGGAVVSNPMNFPPIFVGVVVTKHRLTVSVCVCVCVYAVMYTLRCMYTHSRMRARVFTCVFACVYACVCVFTWSGGHPMITECIGHPRTTRPQVEHILRCE